MVQNIPTIKISVYIVGKHATWQQRGMMNNVRIPTKTFQLDL